MGKHKNRSPRHIADDQRAQKAVELRIAGKSYDQIAEALGYHDRSTAWKAVDRLLTKRAAETAENADRVLVLELDRLDAMLDALWARRADPAVADRILKIQDRRAKYLGLDAAVKQELSGPDGGAIQIDAREQLTSRIASLIERAAAKRDPGESD